MLKLTHLSCLPVLLFLTLIMSCSCGIAESSKSKPENLIAQDEFVNVLLDFALAESASSINVKHSENIKFDSVYAFNPLKERSIRQSQYDSTLVYYSNHIDEYKKVYDMVLDRLSAIQAESALIKSDSTEK